MKDKLRELAEVVRTAPETIYLQVSDSTYERDEPFPESHDGISWCADSVMPCEVTYIRADLATHPHSPDAADSGRVDADALIAAYDDAVLAQRESGFLPPLAQKAARDSVTHNRSRLRAALAAQGQGEAVDVAHVDPTYEQIEAGKSPIARIDFTTAPPRLIWFKTPRKAVQVDVFTAPPASPAGVPDGRVIVTGFLPKSRVVELRFDSALPAWICEPGVRVTVRAAPCATPEGGEVGL